MRWLPWQPLFPDVTFALLSVILKWTVLWFFLLYWKLLIPLYVLGCNYDRWTMFCSYLENICYVMYMCLLSREQIGSRSILWGVKMLNEAWHQNHLHQYTCTEIFHSAITVLVFRVESTILPIICYTWRA